MSSARTVSRQTSQQTSIPQQTSTGVPLPAGPGPIGPAGSSGPAGPADGVSPGQGGRPRIAPGSGRVARVARSVADLWLLAAVLVAWEVGARATDTLYFPPLSTVLETAGDIFLAGDPTGLWLSEVFWENTLASLWRFAAGWGIAIVVGVAFGVFLGRVRTANKMYGPVVRFFTSLPKVALLPIAVQLFGVTDRMNIFLIFLGTVWIITINACDGIRLVDEAWLRSARSLQLRRGVLYRRVLLPAASPQILAGIRVSLGTALILMVVSELYATTSGVGYQIVYTERTFEYVEMWAWLLVIGAIGIVLNRLFVVVERRLLRWQRRAGLSDL